MIPSFALTTSHSLDLEVPFFRSCDCAIHLSVPSVKDIQVSQYEAYSSHHLRCLRWSCGGPELVRPTTMRCKCLKTSSPTPRTLLPHHDCVLMGILLLRTLCRVCLAAGIKLKYPQQACVGNSFGGCGPLDIKCICANKDLISGLSCCIESKCSPADQQSEFTAVIDL